MEKKVKDTTKKSVKKEEKKLEKAKTEKKEKKENIFVKIGKYFKGVGKEFKRIRWTSGKDLLKYSIATLCFVLFLGLYFYGIDWITVLVRSLAK